MSGLIQFLHISTDTYKQLEKAVDLFLEWNSSVSHFKTTTNKYGRPCLTFQWHESGKGTPLIAPLKSAKAISEQIYAWLATVEYGPEPDHDGHNNKGWTIKAGGPDMGGYVYQPYDVFTVYPEWIEYGK